MKYLTLLSLCSFSMIIAVAQSSRSPNPAEKAAIDKLVNTVSPLMQQFADANWELNDGGPDAEDDYSVQMKPDVVMGVAPFNDYHFSIKEGSPLWNKEMQPLAEILQNPPADYNNKQAMDSYKEVREKFVNQKDIFVEIHVNEKNLPLKPDKNGTRDLKISGCYFSYKQSNDPNNLIGTNGSLVNSYVLIFGNWKNVKTKYYSDHAFFEFPFVHPTCTPFIENVVIIISGNDPRIKELLQKINWNKINEGLTF